MVWFKLFVCAAIILFAGSKLSHYAELIAKKSGLSTSWVGLVMVAFVTSLSQLVTSLSCVVVHDLHDMAVSALMGSCMFNMMVIGLLDFTSKGKPVSHVVKDGHILSAGFGIVLLGFVAVDILFGKYLPIITMVHSMDPITLAFVPLYLLAMWISFKYEQTNIAEIEENVAGKSGKNRSLGALVALFLVCASLIIGASYFLPPLAEDIAKSTGWGDSFIGGSLLAVITCLPELTVSITAARRGAFDMAVASLLGANLCYVVILAVTDFCYLKEPLLRHVSQVNALAALTAMISMGIVVIALTYRSERKFWFIAGDAAGLIFVYILANTLLFRIH